MVKISVTIISFNEEEVIRSTLASLTSFADEVLVVDSFSTDNTVKICKEMNARVIEREFKGYSEQKNFALSQCAYDFVLALDADEAVSEELAKSIGEIKANWQGAGYSCNRLTNYLGKWIRHGSWYPAPTIRLVDRRKAHWSEHLVHEFMELKDGARPIHLKGDLLHHSYTSLSEHIRTINRYSDLGAMDYLARGKTSSLFKIVSRPILRFFQEYIGHRGVLDGKMGFIIAVVNALALFLNFVKLSELEKKQ